LSALAVLLTEVDSGAGTVTPTAGSFSIDIASEVITGTARSSEGAVCLSRGGPSTERNVETVLDALHASACRQLVPGERPIIYANERLGEVMVMMMMMMVMVMII
jgi:archaellin